MKDKKVLVSILGTGQKALLSEVKSELDYRTANYALHHAMDRQYQTAHVAEAIIKLEARGRFDRLTIVGTANSMWDTLYAHCVMHSGMEEGVMENWRRLESAVSEGKVTAGDLALVGAALSELTGISCHCLLIPVGRSEVEFWEIFEAIVDLPEDGQEVSLDFTHGLRYQPFFLFLALQYLRVLHPNIHIGKVYYGAFELSKSHFDGVTPIFDLSPMVKLMDWMQAAFAFREYGDLRGLIEMTQDAKLPPGFLFSAQNFAQTLTLSVLGPKPLRNAAIAFKGNLSKVISSDQPDMRPLKRAAPALLSLPEAMIRTKRDWQMQLVLARRLSAIEGQLGMAILCCWEALINRLGELYAVESHHSDHYRRLSKIARSKKIKMLKGAFVEFPGHAHRLHAMRNAIAHNKVRKEIPLKEVPEVFRTCLAYFEAMLGNARLEELPRLMRF